MNKKLNRLDELIIFNPLSHQSLASIVQLRLNELQALLNSRLETITSTEDESVDGKKGEKKSIDLYVESGAREWLVQEGFDPSEGARRIGRLINRHIRQPLASALLKGTIR